MYPTDYLNLKFKHISYPAKVTFVSSLIIGLLAHFFIMTNMLPNHDSASPINNFPLINWNIAVGRWFIFFPSSLTSGYFTPWINGLFAILYIAFSAIIIVNSLRINKSLYCVLISGLMVSFPMVTGQLAYSFEFIFFGILLASLSVYITIRYRYGFCIGFVFITMSLGVYQAFFSVAAGLSVGVLIFDIIQMKLTLKKIIFKGFKLFFTLFFGIIFYFVVVRLTLILAGYELMSYMGIDEMGRISISSIPHSLRQAYISIFLFFIKDNYGLHWSFMPLFFFITFFMSVIIFVVIIIQKKIYKKKLRLFLLIILLFLFPLACNIIYLMGIPFIYINILYGMVLLPIFIIGLLEFIQDNESHKEKYYILIFKRFVSWVISACFIFCIHNYVILANKAYTKAHIVYEQSYAYSVELSTRIQSADAYTKDMLILLVGTPGMTINQIELFDELKGISGIGHHLPMSYSYGVFMHNFLGFRHGLFLVNDYNFTHWNSQYNIVQEFMNMPLYPEPGSIKSINDVMVVKFSPISVTEPIVETTINTIIEKIEFAGVDDIETLRVNTSDINSLEIIDGNIVLRCGYYDPWLYLPMYYAIEKPRGMPFLEITYINNIAGPLQVFYDYGDVLTEENSFVGTIWSNNKESLVLFPIVGWHEGTQLIAIRLDPPNDSEFTLINIKLLSEN